MDVKTREHLTATERVKTTKSGATEHAWKESHDRFDTCKDYS